MTLRTSLTALHALDAPAVLRVTHGDVVAIRDGFHPFVTAHGYDAYYLNVLAGDRRSMAASDDPRYAHVRREWPPPDPRLPLVPRPRGGRAMTLIVLAVPENSRITTPDHANR